MNLWGGILGTLMSFFFLAFLLFANHCFLILGRGEKTSKEKLNRLPGHQIASTKQHSDDLHVNKSETYELNFSQNTHGLKKGEVLRKCVLGFAEPMTFEKNSMRHWTNTKHGLAHPCLILTSQFNGKSIYHMPKYEPPLVHSSTLNCLQFNFFPIRSSKIASHFKEMKILAFSHRVGLHQTILEHTRDHVTLRTVTLRWSSLMELTHSRRKASFLGNQHQCQLSG